MGENGFKSFQLEIHYNNPWLDTGVVDTSGVRLYYTSKKREHDMGILSLGDPFLGLMDSFVGNGLSSHQFDCPASCSSTSLNQSVTVVLEYLHMHKTGTSMSNYHMRGDGNVIRVGQVQFYDFSQQGAYAVQQEPFEIQPGDSFRTTCQYKSSNNTVFGLSSQNEMCIAFLMYYPRQTRSLFGTEVPFTCGYNIPIPDCVSDWEQTELKSVSDLGRTFGSSPGEGCGATSSALFASSVVSFTLALTAAVFSVL